MKRLSICIMLASSFLSSPSHAQSSASTSGAASDSNASASSSPTVNTTTNSGSQSSSGSLSGAAASNAGNAQSITNNSYVPDRQTIVTAPTVFAPALTTTLTETCMGSSSLGVSFLGFGAGGASTWQDHECVRRLNARELAQTLNDRDAAREVLCGNDAVFRAYDALGRPCRLRPDGSPNPAWVPAAAAAPPPPPPPAAEATHFTVIFGFASAALSPDSAHTLDIAALAYQKSGQATVVVSGHTDRAGTSDFNTRLSKQRAEAVRAYLIARGVPDEVQKIIAMGETAPLIPTADGVREGRNRRVEITFGPGAGL